MKFLKHLIVFCLGAFSVVYLANPTAGFFELIPDNLPLVGNIDEAAATALLLACLAYFGIDATRFFRGHAEKDEPPRSDKDPK